MSLIEVKFTAKATRSWRCDMIQVLFHNLYELKSKRNLRTSRKLSVYVVPLIGSQKEQRGGER